MIVIDGKQIALDIKHEIATEVSNMLDHGKSAPHLSTMIIGNDGAALTYVESIERNCREVGFISSVYKFSETTSEREVLEAIDFINKDDEIDGFILQLPLSKHISNEKILEKLNPNKDVDCFTAINNGKLLLGEERYIPATPYGVMELLRRSNITTEGKNCVVVGRSNIVGKPLAMLLARTGAEGNATVTICHSKTQHLDKICSQADILLVAIGKPELITEKFVKKDAVVIDIGIHRIVDPNTEKGYRVCGDVKYDEVAPKTSYITPVPGGVGPLTMSCLLLNTLKARKLAGTD
ncbi:MAG: bifunctional 5,10-methylenetetrahydrofolate dehydrogenase/5,10-methenyltetrahydrofolate cyclohydrolase [Bacteroidales bacterium]|jgi:methylenetetrahydrofolate dehydrogenase (NADP+)/methenyltetrahydrofolate cyclohydrolase|nr:bifunctional 5,10-methylenetetrahydrofolate dehydrogenase/5,10-methenyltetrahydrofolate cyclohydrolase [Bacteroidales bacterium]